jgi:hypothetical protein
MRKKVLCVNAAKYSRAPDCLVLQYIKVAKSVAISVLTLEYISLFMHLKWGYHLKKIYRFLLIKYLIQHKTHVLNRSVNRVILVLWILEIKIINIVFYRILGSNYAFFARHDNDDVTITHISTRAKNAYQ